MREEFLNVIRCPNCRSSDFECSILEKNSWEVREGRVTCMDCSREYGIHKGILDLLPDPSDAIQSEQKGWVKLLGETNEELVHTMLSLPSYEGEIWQTVSRNFDQALSLIDFENARVLDIGAGRCWSTRRMADSGTKSAIALDILLERFIGLETAEVFFEADDGLYFERLVGDMEDLPLQSESFDVVFMTGTLHHTSDIACVMGEIARVLSPGGKAVIINEPVCSLLRGKDLDGSEEVEHGINENIYSIFEYLSAARRAGLRSELFFPRSISQSLDQGQGAAAQEMGGVGHRVISAMWKWKIGRRLVRGPMLKAAYLIASMPLVMIAGKPLEK